MQWYGKQTSGTTITKADPTSTLNELFKDTPITGDTTKDLYRLLNEDLSVPFVVVLHPHKRITTTITKPKMVINPDKLLFPADVGGLLYNTKTREIIDYTRIPYASGTLVEMSIPRRLRVINKDPHRLVDPQIGFEWNSFKNREKYVKFNMYDELRDINNYVLIDFAYMEV
jgi:hypothetical protein